jgi:CheY-like chemotaxis protein
MHRIDQTVDVARAHVDDLVGDRLQRGGDAWDLPVKLLHRRGRHRHEVKVRPLADVEAARARLVGVLVVDEAREIVRAAPREPVLLQRLVVLEASHMGLVLAGLAGHRGGVASATQGTILVLDENAAIQELIDQTLREADHRVLTTNNALEALEVVRRVRVDVLVIGLLLLDEAGRTLVGQFRAIQGGIRIVSISGTDDELGGVDDRASLSSPFALDGLHEAVAAALRSPRDD